LRIFIKTLRKVYKEWEFKITKMFGLFGHKKRTDKLQLEVRDSFDHVKKDFQKVGEWIKHLDGKHGDHRQDVGKIQDEILTIQKELGEIKDFISFFGPQLSKQSSHQEVKQTLISAVQTPVQTPVQTDVLDNLTVMERAIVWALLNAEMKLSYEDLAALLGKDKSTIRGQINSIKQKSEGLIEEYRESNGKKRLFIPEEIGSIILKSVKVRVKEDKKFGKMRK